MLKELIPYFAMTVLFVIPGLIGLTAIILWFKSRNRLYQSIDDAIDKGAPQEVIDQLVELTKAKEEKNDGEANKSVVKHLSDGAVLFGLGIAFIVFYFNGGVTGTIFPGTFLTLFGLGKFVIAAYVARRNSTQGE